jgi:hypothetical protein
MSERRLMDLKDASGWLSISPRSLERLVANEEIEVVRLPGVRKLLFRIEDLEKLVKESRTVPAFVPTSRHKLAVLRGGGQR